MAEPVLIKPEIFSSFPEVIAVLTTRNAGINNNFNLSFSTGDDPESVKFNRKILLEHLKISESQLAIPKQIHSSNVCYAENPGIYENCDALFTNQEDIFLVVSVADCIPVFVYEPEMKIVALIHAGWRGIKDNIVEKTLSLIKRRTPSSNIYAYIGPGASVCCYEVDEEVANFFDVRFKRFKRDGKFHLDLKSAVFSQLLNSGIKFSNIEVSNFCTICRPDLFHSYRRDKERSGRMWAILGVKS